MSMFKHIPKIPYFLNLFPYAGPVAFEPCLNCPKPGVMRIVTIISKAKGMITKCAIEIKIFRGCNSNFNFVFCPGVGDDFPVVDATGEPDIGDHGSEDIGLFLQEDVSVGLADDDSASKFRCVPGQIIAVGGPDDFFGFGLGDFSNDFIHFGIVAEMLGQLVEHLAGQRAIRFIPFDRFVLNLFTILEVPAFHFQAEFLVDGQVKQLDNFLAFGVGASDIKAVV